MSSLPSGSSETEHRSIHKWYFTKEEAANTASIRDGFTPEKELTYRQQATRFIQMMVDQLNHNVRDQRGKISQLCMCAAIMHMQRFYCFHTFRMFDYRDIAAACLFLAGKSEECPRKLDHIVRVWWAKKFDRHPTIPSNNVHNKKLTEFLVLVYIRASPETIVFVLSCYISAFPMCIPCT
uniref:Cyclin N-terminal domain-containing protein n=1 Tax=Angiostrongylus cantonensis TaxID=6313 RepID=A0A0K0DDG8_ANGCA